MQRKFQHTFEVVLVLFVLIAHLYVALAPANSLMNWYTTDDAYYYFKTAQNFVEGRGLSFDGIGRSNGFHPLWMVICIPVFTLAHLDRMLPLRIIVMIAAFLNAGTAIMIYRLLKAHLSEEVGILAAAFWTLSVQIHTVTTTLGMESGINAFFLVLLVTQVARLEEKRKLSAPLEKDFRLAGVFGLLAVLSRLDNVFLVGIMGLWLVLRFWMPVALEGQSIANVWNWRMRLAANFYLPIIIVMVLYLGGNYLYFGTPMPVSGQIKRWWSTLPNTVYGYPVDSFLGYLGNWVTPQQDIGPWSMATSILHTLAGWLDGLFKISGEELYVKNMHRLFVLFAALLTGTLIGYLVKKQWKRFITAANSLGLAPFFLGCFFQITAYKATSYVETLTWYWVSEIVFTVLIGGVLVQCLLDSLVTLNVGRMWPRLAGLAAILGLLWTFSSHLTSLIPINVPAEEERAYLAGVEELEKVTEPGSIIGSTGGGVLGYFITGRTVVNLDGLINSYDYFQKLKKGRVQQYYDAIGLDYVYGNNYMITASDPYARAFENRLELIENVANASLFRYLKPLNQQPATKP